MTDAGLSQGLVHLPGSSYETKALVQRLLDEDTQTHHCFYGKIGLHNHLPHHILAAYDLGAPPKVLQAIYDAEAERQSPINLVDRKEQIVAPPDVVIATENWTEHIGFEKNYAAFLVFFKTEVQRLGVAESLDEYIFSPRANGNNNDMLLRVVGGALHPLIQIGYGVEFNMPSLVASGLAETAVTRPIPSSLYDDSPEPAVGGTHLLSVLKDMYHSDILMPVMPYQPDALLSKRMADALTAGRPAEIRRLSAQWALSASPGAAELDARTEEVIWAATLLTVATGRPGRAPRLDFFLMHLLTSALFLPPLVRALRTPANTARLLRVYVAALLFIVLVRGRPRIDAALAMSRTAVPRAPGPRARDADADGDNPWLAIVEDVVHAPDAHTVKTVRALCYAAQRYGETPPGGMVGAFDADGRETLAGTGALDGTLFVRAAGVVMDTLGWVTHGQKEGAWDRSALGWDAAWDDAD